MAFPSFTIENKYHYQLMGNPSMTTASISQATALPLTELFHTFVLRNLFEKMSEVQKASSIAIIASQFAKRYCYSFFIPSLQQLWTDGNYPAIQPNRDIISYCLETGSMEYNRSEHATYSCKNKCTIQKMDDYIVHYFADHLVLLWKTIVEVTGIKMDLLWENAYIYIRWAYMQTIPTPNTEKMFLYLTKYADGSLFGLSKNPFATFDASSPVRKRCCLYFLLPSSQEIKCKTCPLSACNK
jgi:ferric iron reductase protein FhuF